MCDLSIDEAALLAGVGLRPGPGGCYDRDELAAYVRRFGWEVLPLLAFGAGRLNMVGLIDARDLVAHQISARSYESDAEALARAVAGFVRWVVSAPARPAPPDRDPPSFARSSPDDPTLPWASFALAAVNRVRQLERVVAEHGWQVAPADLGACCADCRRIADHLERVRAAGGGRVR